MDVLDRDSVRAVSHLGTGAASGCLVKLGKILRIAGSAVTCLRSAEAVTELVPARLTGVRLNLETSSRFVCAETRLVKRVTDITLWPCIAGSWG